MNAGFASKGAVFWLSFSVFLLALISMMPACSEKPIELVCLVKILIPWGESIGENEVHVLAGGKEVDKIRIIHNEKADWLPKDNLVAAVEVPATYFGGDIRGIPPLALKLDFPCKSREIPVAIQWGGYRRQVLEDAVMDSRKSKIPLALYAETNLAAFAENSVLGLIFYVDSRENGKSVLGIGNISRPIPSYAVSEVSVRLPDRGEIPLRINGHLVETLTPESLSPENSCLFIDVAGTHTYKLRFVAYGEPGDAVDVDVPPSVLAGRRVYRIPHPRRFDGTLYVFNPAPRTLTFKTEVPNVAPYNYRTKTVIGPVVRAEILDAGR